MKDKQDDSKLRINPLNLVKQIGGLYSANTCNKKKKRKKKNRV